MLLKKLAGFAFISLLIAASPEAFAQRSRITSPIDARHRVALRGNLTPRAEAGQDNGTVDLSLMIPAVSLVLEPSAEQSSALEQFLAEVQNPQSPTYHKWLTPEQYGDRFGASAADVARIRAWVEENGLEVTSVARARNRITFRGTAGQIQDLLKTEIHSYLVNGELHFANATEPQIPAGLQGMIRSIGGLHDFRMKSRAVRFAPRYTSSSGKNYLSPGDFATIYNTKPLLDAGITGAGQKIVVVGQSNVRTNDMSSFRSYFSMTANAPQLVLIPTSKDPGIVDGDVDEAALDIQWTGAVAPDATIFYVYGQYVEDSLSYAIDQNLAPIISMSYGLCEQEYGASDAAAYALVAKQAAAQGITWFAAAGDDGAIDCGITSRFNGLGVDLPAALPEVTGVGGTTFNEAGDTATYWNTTNTSARASALLYIPETAWNDSVTGSLSSSGGGASLFFQKPAWQTGTGVPNDNARDVPDVALSASAQHVGYMIYSSGLSVIGGTSAGAPSMAGIAALLNQYLQNQGTISRPGLGNINPRLYALAQSSPNAFHDVTTGNNIVSACRSTRGCSSTPVGYNAGIGYDQVTGLGTIDAYALVTSWSSGVFTQRTASLAVTSSAATITTADTATVTATLTGTGGTIPTGTVTFSFGGTTLGTSTLSSAGTASIGVNAAYLTVGKSSINVSYSGDSIYAAATGTVVISVVSLNAGPPAIAGIAHAASFKQAFAPGMILSVFGTGLSPVVLSASTVPLPTALGGVSVTINGVSAPLYYVSPTQLNVQIPYETKAGQSATLTVSVNGLTATTTFTPTATAPGVFVDSNNAPVPGTSGKAGSTLVLFVTGVGALTPAVTTGSAPIAGTPLALLPVPAQKLALTIDGVATTLAFAGNPAGLVGVTQVNYTIPGTLAAGTHSLVISVGGVTSSPVTLTVTP